jgi:hypothetical protein
MAMGMPAAQARVLGFDPPTNFTSAGNSQTTATLLTANHAVVTTTTGQGAIIGDAQQMWYVQVVTGGNLSVYPPVGGTFSGLTLNAAITVPGGKAIFIEPGGLSGITWSVSA